MELILALVVGVLYASGLYLMMRRSIVKLILGLAILSHAANLLIFTAGGLVRAYSDSVSQALSGARLVRREHLQLFSVPAGHAAAGRLENELRGAGVQVLGTDYLSDGARIQVALPDSPETLAGFRERLAALTGGGPAPDLGHTLELLGRAESLARIADQIP